MRRTTTKLILAGLVLSASASAQNTLTSLLQAGPVAGGGTFGKSTAMMSRPIAGAYYNFDNGVSYEFQDTTMLTYSGERGADSTLTMIKFDQYIYRSMVSNVLTNQIKMNNTYDGNDNVLTSLTQNWDIGLSTWINDENLIYTYDGNNNMLTQIAQNWNTGTNSWENDVKYTYTYDGNNNKLTEVRQNWNSGTMAWDNSSKTLYSYNSNNDVVTTISQIWDNVGSSWENDSRRTNTYDSNNDMIESLLESWSLSSWTSQTKELYTYDGDHHMLTSINQYFSGVWVNSSKNIYTYTGDHYESITNQGWNNVGMTWENMHKYNYTYDGNNDRISEVYQVWNSGSSAFENEWRNQWTYNNYHQPTSLWSEQWNSGIWEVTTNDDKIYIYYEEYEVAGIDNIAAANDLKMYPVPAANFIRIEKVWAQPQDFTVSITDMQGRLIRTYNEKATANYARSIDVNQLANGNYMIRIAPKSGKVSYQQFSVIH